MKRKLLVLGSLLALAACGGTDPGSAPDIATLATPAAGTSTAAPPVAAPVIRPDTTPEEEHVMQQPYLRCVREKGMAVVTDASGLLAFDYDRPDWKDALHQPEYADCQRLWPVMSPEMDPDQNPYYEEDFQNFERCRAEHGEPLIKENGQWVPGPGWHDWPPDDAMVVQCQIQAFDGKKG